MEGNSNLKKLTRNQKLKIVHEEEQLQTILDQLNASDDLQVNSQQTLDTFSFWYHSSRIKIPNRRRE